jgi:hypothetical protein
VANPSKAVALAAAIAVVAGILPLWEYWYFVGRVPSVTLPFRESSLLEQWALVLTGFVVKPLYMLLALGLAAVLWRRREADLAALFWAMAAFFVGEAFCAANYLAYGERSLLFEYLHCYGMVLSFGLVTFAVLEGVDRRLVKLSDPGATCAAIALCQQCVKYKPVPCGLKRVFLVVIPAAIVMALAPLTASLAPVAYNTRILGTFYTHTHAIAHQVFEIRYLPMAALVLLAIALAVLLFKRAESIFWSKLFFSAGMGAMGFSYFRAILLHLYRDNLAWFAIWEEVTELLFVVGTISVLWIFRRGLNMPARAA